MQLFNHGHRAKLCLNHHILKKSFKSCVFLIFLGFEKQTKNPSKSHF